MYVERTKIDFLAVSVGTIHGRQPNRSTKLDFKRLKRINDELGIPLVLHGGSGLIEEQYHKLILNGVAKINCYTELSDIAAAVIRSNSQKSNKKGYIESLHGVKESLQEQIKLYMHLWGSAGRAAEVLIQCRPWQPVEQIIVCNVESRYLQQFDTLTEQARKTLMTIPGVRQVFSGWELSGRVNIAFVGESNWHTQMLSTVTNLIRTIMLSIVKYPTRLILKRSTLLLPQRDPVQTIN